MERLTKRRGNDIVLNDEEQKCRWGLPIIAQKMLLKTLCAYEDTGLTPKEIINLQQSWDMYGGEVGITTELEELQAYRTLGSLDHLRDLVQAEKDGQLVVLPCKIGTPVYAVNPPIKGIAATVICTHFDYGLVPYWKKIVFATREEAEAALKGGAE